ncbi:DNA repair protein rad2 [Steccherinum ochraceum]|uniref:DNA repair protein rad2 n=1 Tax=Steccherinum ochraceum TaxID=92696 RepID=A0A4V2MV52_9APHY|nr:DNA repair protein rad2 [Steccherinum ochraceum]
MGVKSLWTLLEPVGRPVPLETMEGKAMAIDSSIWIYQFQATMRDKEGRGLVNAHVVGFLRRICKLLFYGIKPVFVFDGGAPALKRTTISERKNKKAGAAASHAKIAERLLAAQMRREAVNHIEAQSSKGKGKAVTEPEEEIVYMEDLDPSLPKTPARPARPDTQTSPQSSGKKRWRDHDPYRLPEVDMDALVAKATSTAVPDPRLATEDELRAFIEEMKPEDFDVGSQEFRELPTEVQYEIIGDLRLKSRQTSYKRLQNMLRHAKTPMDFSKEQIKNLKQRNSLTQQLLTTTDSIGKAHVEIPIRIASERNRQYILVKNEGEAGGWVLGIRDEGTKAKPIEIDQDPVKPPETQDDDSDMDMEEVDIAAPVYDPDLREYRRSQALSALADRYSPKKLAPLTTKKVNRRKPNSKPLFALNEDPAAADQLDEEDLELLAAMHRSVEDAEEEDLQRAIEESTAAAASWGEPPVMEASTSRSTLDSASPHTTPRHVSQTLLDSDSDDDLYASPTRLETALSIANAGPSNTRTHPPSRAHESAFGLPSLLVSPTQSSSPKSALKKFSSPPENKEKSTTPRVRPRPLSPSPVVRFKTPPRSTPVQHTSSPIVIPEDEDDDDMEVVQVPQVSVEKPTAAQRSLSPIPVDLSPKRPSLPTRPEVGVSDIIVVSDGEEDDEEMEEVVSLPTVVSSAVQRSPSSEPVAPPEVDQDDFVPIEVSATAASEVTLVQDHPSSVVPNSFEEPSDSDSDVHSTRWSRSPSPTLLPNPSASTSTSAPPQPQRAEEWDAAHEMDPQAEEKEYAEFMSQVRGKDLDVVRKEIDEEIQNLNQQRKTAMRDAEDVTQQMVSQIMMMLRLFGIPYITAPMEAEAQCAELLNLSLVDGIITDDSDVFLFGGGRVFKNMFNQSKTVECFLSSDLERELGLERDKLIRLAYLLGSDYTEGLLGVGPVVAMELLTEFTSTSEDALFGFKEWWRRVQSGRDSAAESGSKFKKRFKKRFKELFLPEDWPNPAVRDAYYHPTVDHSDEPFKWGLPDLDALREFFNAELGWNQSKVDDLLLPIIQKMNKRSQQGAMNKQGNLLGFFDAPAGVGMAPRKRQAYSSKRLQQVVADFRKKQRADSASTGADGSRAGSSSESEAEEEERPKKKRKTANRKRKGQAKDKEKEGEAAEDGGEATTTSKRGRGAARGRGRGRGKSRGRGGAKAGGASRKRKAKASDSESEFEGSGPEAAALDAPGASDAVPLPPIAKELRPRPKPTPKPKPTMSAEGVEDGQPGGDEGVDVDA